MEKREISLGSITANFIFTIIAFTIVGNILLYIIALLMNTALKSIAADNLMLFAITSATMRSIVTFVVLFFICKLSVSTIFKRKYISEDTKKKFYRNIVICFIIFALLAMFYSVFSYLSSIQDLETTVTNQVSPYANLLGGEAAIEKLVASSMENLRVPLIVEAVIMGVCIVASYLIMIPLSKKWVEKKNQIPFVTAEKD